MKIMKNVLFIIHNRKKGSKMKSKLTSSAIAIAVTVALLPLRLSQRPIVTKNWQALHLKMIIQPQKQQEHWMKNSISSVRYKHTYGLFQL